MEIARIDPKTVLLRDINSFAAGLLRRIPLEADPGDDAAAHERLFSKPVVGGKGGKLAKELNEEWKLYVEPELDHIFQSANETVSGDLKQLRQTGGDEGSETYELGIPVSHLEQWLNTLNQARLVIAARNGFTEVELDGDLPQMINSTRDMNLLQMHFYGEMQHVFIRHIEVDA